MLLSPHVERVIGIVVFKPNFVYFEQRVLPVLVPRLELIQVDDVDPLNSNELYDQKVFGLPHDAVDIIHQ